MTDSHVTNTTIKIQHSSITPKYLVLPLIVISSDQPHLTTTHLFLITVNLCHFIISYKWSHTMYTFRRSSFFFLPFLSAPLYSWAVSHYINASQFIHPLPDIYNYRKTQQLNSGTIIPDKWKLVFTQNLYINVDKRFICNKWKLESPQISFNNWMI